MQNNQWYQHTSDNNSYYLGVLNGGTDGVENIQASVCRLPTGRWLPRVYVDGALPLMDEPSRMDAQAAVDRCLEAVREVSHEQ